ncbi:IclR family transcriptional regulator [Pseudomonas sp. DR 5-09]|uniref:IclR family transcriptional regulator n=1 Tax=Pseudomonas sp. DR 5-09 TaxID=1534110 RepID=UPI0007E42819|nr:IclR family transcriptional regulator [Pseudomonas sp. DR 5-09]
MNQADESVEKAGGIQVIARAASIMRALGEHPQGLSLAAIAQLVSLPRSTVQRIINALEEEFLVEALGPSGGFKLGPALGQLINQAQTDIISLIKPYLQSLADELQESVCLASLAGDKIYVLDRIVAERELRVVFPIGINVPATSTAAGKALLATLPVEALRALLLDPLPVFTANTLDRQALDKQLSQVQAGAVATDRDEHIEGVCSFAVPLDTYLGYFSIAIVLPSSRATSRTKVLQSALRDSKQKIERAIGRASKKSS